VKTMKMLVILGASAIAAFGQSVVVTIPATSPTQALTYTSPVNSACTVEISESSTYSPLVHDVDGSLFAGAGLDSRADSIDSAGNLRIFVAGTRAIQTASIATQVASHGGANFGAALAYLVSPAGAPVNPTWTDSQSEGAGLTIASFSQSSVPTTPPPAVIVTSGGPVIL
jgi:hypothetical protein